MATDNISIRRSGLTVAQNREAVLLFDRGFSLHHTSYRSMPRNRPLWKLVEMGLAEFGKCPRNSWLTTNGFLPIWSDPIC